MRWTRLLIGVAALLCAACAGPSTSPSTSDQPTGAATGIDFGARYTCGEPFTFGPDLLDRPGGDEDAATPLAAALRATVGPPRNPDEDASLPKDGWILVGQRGAQAQYVAPGDGGIHVVSLAAPGGIWRVMDRGFCSPSLRGATGDHRRRVGPRARAGDRAGDTVVHGSGHRAGVCVRDVRGRPHHWAAGGLGRRAGTRHVRGPGDPGSPRNVRGTRTFGSGSSSPEPLGDRVLRDGSRLPARDPIPVECCGLQSSGARG